MVFYPHNMKGDLRMNKGRYRCLILALIVLMVSLLTGCNSDMYSTNKPDGVFRVLMSNDIKDAALLLEEYAKQHEDVKIEVAYQDMSSIVRILEGDSCIYDAVWINSSLYLNILNTKQRILNSKFTCITPIVFGVKKSMAEELDLVKDGLSITDIHRNIHNGNLSFVMPSVTQESSGLTAYLGFATAFAGNPDVLQLSDVKNPEVLERLKELFSGVARSSGDIEYTKHLALSGEYDCLVSSESTFISINKELEARGEEPYYLLYPSDGITIAEMPFAYIDKGEESKSNSFTSIQNYICGQEGRKLLSTLGKRTEFGGISESVYNPAWGIGKNYLRPITLPSKDVVREALLQYQNTIRKPSRTVYCLDFSGSMGTNGGYGELQKALEYVLNPITASEEFIAYNESDFIYLIPFEGHARKVISGSGADYEYLLSEIGKEKTGGGTNIYAPIEKAISLLQKEGKEGETLSIFLMTDGDSAGSVSAIEEMYKSGKVSIPIYSFMFGSAMPGQLDTISKITNGKTFDVRGSNAKLVESFKQGRGYNN